MTTPRLSLPEIVSNQAQKEVTHNQALQRLDAFVQSAIEDRDLTAPPGSPAEGSLYIVAAGATGAWDGHDGDIAQYYGGSWYFYPPWAGLTLWVSDEGLSAIYDGVVWEALESAGTAAEAIAAHEADPDPHPQYTTDVEAQVIAQYERAAHEAAYPHPEFVRADFAATHRLTTDATTGVLLLEEL